MQVISIPCLFSFAFLSLNFSEKYELLIGVKKRKEHLRLRNQTTKRNERNAHTRMMDNIQLRRHKTLSTLKKCAHSIHHLASHKNIRDQFQSHFHAPRTWRDTTYVPSNSACGPLFYISHCKYRAFIVIYIQAYSAIINALAKIILLLLMSRSQNWRSWGCTGAGASTSDR